MHPFAQEWVPTSASGISQPGLFANIAKHFFLYERGSLLDILGWQFLRSLPVDVKHGLGLHFVWQDELVWAPIKS